MCIAPPAGRNSSKRTGAAHSGDIDSILMARKKSAIFLMVVTSFLALLAVIGIELTSGLSLTRGLRNLPVQEIYVMADTDKIYLSVDLDPSATGLKTIRVPLSEIAFEVNPALTKDMAISSTDVYIWGDRWPWVEKVTITLKTEQQKEGFDTLFAPEKLQQLQDDLAKGNAVGVTHSGHLTSGGRIME